MEKELNIESESFNICFYYEDFSFNAEELAKYSESLKWMANAFENFLKNELKLADLLLNLNINICSNEMIKELNLNYRQKDKITDVLSFPLQENIRSDDYDKFSPEIELGDLYICHSVCLAQAEEFKLSFQDEFIHLSTHGFLHLIGYDHEISDEEEKLMEAFEEKIIHTISNLKNNKY